MVADPLVRIDEVTYHTPGFAMPLCHGLSLALARGETVGLHGPHRCGKTTILTLLLAGTPYRRCGSVSVMGRDPAALSDDGLLDLRRRIGVVAQRGALVSTLTLRDNLLLPYRYHRRGDAAGELAAMTTACAQLDLDPEDIPACRSEDASMEMIQLIALAKALILDPDLLILDEPARHLSGAARQEYWRLVRRLHAGGRRGILVATGDRGQAEAAGGRVIGLPPI
jgi:ABC-type multidrug transport system ATPase subunit